MANTLPASEGYQGLILFERGYRPFFLGAALFAGFAIPLWVVLITTGMEIPSHFSAREYHTHEMIFGYLGAVLAGFLFTALPNWTGRPAIAGLQLAFLSILWLAGRLAMLTSAPVPMAAAGVDAAFLLTVCALAWRDVILGGSIRNMPVCLLVSLLAIANIIFHVMQLQGGETAWIERAAFTIIALMMSLIGGRVVPTFSSNWMKERNIHPLPAGFSFLDKAVLAATLLTPASWSAAPEATHTGYLFSALCALHAVRLARWRGWQTTALILHIGYLWLPLWFGLHGLAILAPDLFSASSALHAFTTGAIGTLTMQS